MPSRPSGSPMYPGSKNPSPARSASSTCEFRTRVSEVKGEAHTRAGIHEKRSVVRRERGATHQALDDEVRRGADDRDEAPEDARERQRHEQDRWGEPPRPRPVLGDGDQQGHDRGVVEEGRQEKGEAHEAEEARCEARPQAEDVLGRSVGQPGPLDALDHDEQGAHRQNARVAETRQGVLRGDGARVPDEHKRKEYLCGVVN